ncbi:MAG: ABC transporter substrate-binding protein [Thermoanaerobacteraceae bacterium]|nr:ABC transporter substrate-binding protein [Thermoanaerobacteraceae bacterium]
MKRKICFLMIFVLMMSLLSACSHTNPDQTKKSASSTNTPNEKQSMQIVTDDLGRKIEIPKNPQRIICFSSDDVGTLFAIGAGDKVVGRPAYETFPKEAEKIPDVGVPGGPVPQPNMEKVLSLKPDLILMTTSITLQGGQWSGPSKDLVDKLENLNLKVIVFDTPKTVENNLEKIKRVGRIVGKEKGSVSLLRIGKIEHSMEGCACPMGAVARDFLNHLVLKEGEWVLVDTEAGVEHFGRGVIEGVDSVIMVVDPSYEAVLLAEKAAKLTHEAKKKFGVVLNKVNEKTESDLKEMLAGKGIEIKGIMPFSEQIARSNLLGGALDIDAVKQELDKIINELIS